MRIRVLQVFFAIALIPIHALAINYPHYQSTFINDFANILPDDSEVRINEVLNQLKIQRDVEMTVVTINSTKDYGHTGALESFATGLFNDWGIGDAKRNDGIMLLIAVNDRAMRIELGKGYPKHFDKTAQSIIDSSIIPDFKNGNFPQGIEKGVQEIVARIRLDTPLKSVSDSNPGNAPATHLREEKSQGFLSKLWHKIVAGVVGLAAFVGGGMKIKNYFRYRPRRCDLCRNLMHKLSDIEEDNYLSDGQQSEEALGSIQYDVWFCSADNNVLVCDYNKWFSGFCTCKFCKNKTVESTTKTLQHATEYSSGNEEINYHCQHCKQKWSEIRTIPRKSSSSSSSSSSFSGGSSSGGGASGRW